MAERFLTLIDVAEELNVSVSQARALVKSGALPAIRVGGRGQYRIERSQIEAYISRGYAEQGWFRSDRQLADDDARPSGWPDTNSAAEKGTTAAADPTSR